MRDAAASVRAAKGDGVNQLVGAIRQQLASRVLEPLDLVLLAADRVQAALDDAVERGRVTRGDANQIASDLLRRGREQTDDVLANLDELLGRGIDQLEALSRAVAERSARSHGAESLDRLLQSADRARRAVGVGPAFPILGYDELSVPRIRARLRALTADELRVVREHETRNANRAAVLRAIDRAIG